MTNNVMIFQLEFNHAAPVDNTYNYLEYIITCSLFFNLFYKFDSFVHFFMNTFHTIHLCWIIYYWYCADVYSLFASISVYH